MLQRPTTRPRGQRIAIAIGRGLAVVSLGAWAGWLSWRMATIPSVFGLAVFALEMTAFVAAVALTAGMWAGVRIARGAESPHGGGGRVRALLAIDRSADAPAESEPATQHREHVEWMVARDGIHVVRSAFASDRDDRSTSGVELSRMVLATEGIRRAAMVAALVAVLLTGTIPIDVPPIAATAALACGIFGVALAHLLLSSGSLRPGDRLVWSMSTIGAGLGPGRCSSGVSVRWTATMATIVILNLAVALRGVSDRWTHGLGDMSRDVRIGAMAVAFALVVTGYAALRRLPPPELGRFGATGRLEELSTRRWALGATGAFAVVGLVVGSLPAGVGT